MTFAAAFYTGIPSGYKGIPNRVIRAFEGGDKSHCEIVFSNGDSASSSLMDHGVRFTGDGYKHTRINFYNGNWKLYVLPQRLEKPARAYAESHEGRSYDIRGNLRFVFPWENRDSKDKDFCSEFVLSSLGISEAWRFGVNPAAAICQFISENG